jgi:hypothetical protein
MKQLCIFTAPKPFRDEHVAMIQRNATRSWVAMSPDVEVFLVGDEEGVAQAAKELGVGQIKDVKCNAHGTPLVSSIFDVARRASAAPLLAYVNADILLFPETLPIAQNVAQQTPNFVLLGQRYDLDVESAIDFSTGWDEHLLQQMHAQGHLHPLGGSDYFIFSRHLYTQIPNFAIGRAGWDNWMIYQAVMQSWSVIDATPTLTIVHQNHDYAHLQNERGHQRHEETFENTELGGGMRKMYMLLDVPYQLVDGKVRRATWSLPRVLRSLERRLQPHELVGRGLGWFLLRRLRRWRRALLASKAN